MHANDRALRRRALSSAIAIAAASASTSAIATTYEVGPGKAYASLAPLEDSLQPGDVVVVQGDATYAGGLTFTGSGTLAQKITIKGVRVNGKRPVISGGSNTVEFVGDHYLFEGFDVTGGDPRCIFHHGHDLTVRDTVVHGCPAHGILGADSDSGSITLDYVEVYDAGDGDTRHPIYIATDESAHPGSVFRMQHSYVHDGNGGNNVKTRAERNEIYYNWIEGALYHELELIGPDGQDPGLAREDSDVVGNVFRKTGQHFVTRVGGDGTGDTSGRYRFVNNTFILAPGSSAAFRLFDGIESIEMHNNVFYRAGGGGVQIINDSSVSWSTGVELIAGGANLLPSGSSSVPDAWIGTLTGDPGFADVAALDFRPGDGSALVDAGLAALAGVPGHAFPSPLDAPAFLPPPGDIEAVGQALARPVDGAIDIGAFELAGEGSGSASSGSASSASASASGSGAGGSTSAAAGGGEGATSGGATAGATGGGGGDGDGGAVATSGAGAGDGAGGTDFLGGDPPKAGEPIEGGCACTTAPSRAPAGALALAALGLALAFARRRRS